MIEQLKWAYRYNKRLFILAATFDATLITAAIYFGLSHYGVI